MSILVLLGTLGVGAGLASAAGTHTSAATRRDASTPTTALPVGPDQVATARADGASLRPAVKGSGAAFRPVTRVTGTSGGPPTRGQRATLIGVALALPLGTWLMMAASDRYRRRRRR